MSKRQKAVTPAPEPPPARPRSPRERLARLLKLSVTVDLDQLLDDAARRIEELQAPPEPEPFRPPANPRFGP